MNTINTVYPLLLYCAHAGFYWLSIVSQGMDDQEEPMVAFLQQLATNPKENAMLTALV